MRLALLALAALAVIVAPTAAAGNHEPPPEGCTVKVTDPVVIYNPINGRPITLVPETWICPPPL